MLYEICAVIATLAFVALVIYLIQSLSALNRLITRIDTKIEPLSEKTITLLEHSSNISHSVSQQLTAFNPLLESVSNLGQALNNSSFFMKEEKKTEWNDIARDSLEIALLGLSLLDQLKKGDPHVKKYKKL